MKNLKILILLFSMFGLSAAQAYTSQDSYEADLTFTGTVVIAEGTPDYMIRPSFISRQLLYLAGPLQAALKKSAAKNNEQITILDKYRDSQTGRLYARYEYRGTFVLENGIQGSLTIHLPLDMDTIWQKASPKCYSDPNHIMAYYWNPLERGCNLTAGLDYFTVNAPIVKRSNTVSTFPAYDRMADSSGEIRMILAFGADNDEKGKTSPERNDDYNAASYRDTRSYILKQGFTSRLVPQSEREQECGSSRPFGSAPGYVEELTRQDGARKLVVRLFWGVANIGDDSAAFFCMIKEGAERSSVIIYSGHSRVGGLDLTYMGDQIGRPIVANKNQYQIFGFFGCSSYSYYNQTYFAAKASPADPTGSWNTDIITNGIAGSFYSMTDFNTKTIAPILNWSSRGSKSSWQQIMGSYSKNFLTGVNGDE